MTIEVLLALAIYTLALWFVVDHFVGRRSRDEDLGEVDVEDRLRKRALEAADRERLIDEISGFAHAIGCPPLEPWQREQMHRDIVTRRERMQHHPQRVMWHL